MGMFFYYKLLIIFCYNINMKKQIKEHISFIENILKKEDTSFDWRGLGDFNRAQIEFFQHERLVHLLVTLFFGVMFLGTILTELFLLNMGLLIISFILLIVLIFYIVHYFFLENSVQKLYKLHKKINENYQKNYAK
jgi:hypothetical protein